MHPQYRNPVLDFFQHIVRISGLFSVFGVVALLMFSVVACSRKDDPPESTVTSSLIATSTPAPAPTPTPLSKGEIMDHHGEVNLS